MGEDGRTKDELGGGGGEDGSMRPAEGELVNLCPPLSRRPDVQRYSHGKPEPEATAAGSDQ